MHAACTILSTAVVMRTIVRSLGAPSALLRMTSLFFLMTSLFLLMTPLFPLVTLQFLLMTSLLGRGIFLITLRSRCITPVIL
jgi:hypothetical protein